MNWPFALAEIIIASVAMLGLMLGVSTVSLQKLINRFYILALLAVAALLFWQFSNLQANHLAVFGKLLLVSHFTLIVKIAIVVASAIIIWLIEDTKAGATEQLSEYSVLILLATTGLMIMISASDLLTLYLGLELSSLPAYIIATFNRKQTRSAEAGLKYLLLGAIASAILVYGISLIYGSFRTTHFQTLVSNMQLLPEGLPLIAILGIVMVLTGIAFKIAAVPFHMWIPDVYEGSPPLSTIFFASCSKFAAGMLFLIACVRFFTPAEQLLQGIVQVLAIASMLGGAIAALRQKNIKRLLAYSSIAHTGFILMGLAALGLTAISAVIYYLLIYLVMAIGSFALILVMRRDDQQLETTGQLAGLVRNHPTLAVLLLIHMFSMAGIPPFGGFFAKLAVFSAALTADLYLLAIAGAVASVISAYYYLNLVKIAFFDEAIERFDRHPKRGFTVIAATAVVLLGFVAISDPLNALTEYLGTSLLFE